MKKSKILIPALSIASVGAVVAPMVTSCGNDGEQITFSKSLQVIKDKVAMQPADFKPEVDPLAKGTQFDPVGKAYYVTNSYDMNERYYIDAAKNPVIMADDLLYTFVKSAEQVSEWGAENMTVTIVNPTMTLTYKREEMSGQIYPVLLWNWITKVDWDKTVDGQKYTEHLQFKYHNVPNAWFFEGSDLTKANPPTYAYVSEYSWYLVSADENTWIEFKDQVIDPNGSVYEETIMLDSADKLDAFRVRYKFMYNFFILNMKIQPKYLENVISTPRYGMQYTAASSYFDAGYYFFKNGMTHLTIDTVKGRRCQFDIEVGSNMDVNKFNLGYYDTESSSWKYVEFGAVSVMVLEDAAMGIGKKVAHTMNATNNELTITEPVTSGQKVRITIITSDADTTVVPFAFYKA